MSLIPSECDKRVNAACAPLRAEIASLRAQLAASGEAKAVAYTFPFEIELMRELPADYGDFQITLRPQADEECSVPLYTHPPANDARDGARYRWLRDNWAKIDAYRLIAREGEFDAKVDAGIAARAERDQKEKVNS